jgi:hypothetical protein
MRMSRFGRNSNEIHTGLALSDEQIARVAPSIFAEGKHESRSEAYTFIPTRNVLDGLRQHGFQPYHVIQSRCRIPGKAEFTKHMLRLRHVDARSNSQETPEVILVNSHDGTSSYQMFHGLFRFVCKNGMIVADAGATEIKIPHKGNVIENVIEGAFSVVKDHERTMAAVDGMKAISLSPGEQSLFAEAALGLRFEADEAGRTPIVARQLLTARRVDDRANDLWTTFNRIQENTVQGGVSGRTAVGRRMSTRAVNGITQNVALNRALWQLAEGMRTLKTGGQIALAA